MSSSDPRGMRYILAMIFSIQSDSTLNQMFQFTRCSSHRQCRGFGLDLVLFQDTTGRESVNTTPRCGDGNIGLFLRDAVRQGANFDGVVDHTRRQRLKCVGNILMPFSNSLLCDVRRGKRTGNKPRGVPTVHASTKHQMCWPRNQPH